MSAEWLRLPLEIQVAIAGGYAAYVIAYSGMRSHHKPIDVAFSTLVFGLFATLVFRSVGSHSPHIAYSAVAAFFAAVLLGVLWRKFGRETLAWTLRKLRISFSDDTPSALGELSNQTNYDVSQFAIKLDDGTWLRCDDTSLFAKLPFGPCVIGQTGDVAMYLTHTEDAQGIEREQSATHDPYYGDRIVYVPAHRIVEYSIRHRERRR